MKRKHSQQAKESQIKEDDGYIEENEDEDDTYLDKDESDD